MLKKIDLLQKFHVKFITDETGRKQSVILRFKDYQDLLEDYQNLALIASRKDDEYISLENALKSV